MVPIWFNWSDAALVMATLAGSGSSVERKPIPLANGVGTGSSGADLVVLLVVVRAGVPDGGLVSLTDEQRVQFRAAVTASWNHPAHVSKWLDHDGLVLDALSRASALLVEAVAPKGGERVLDLASGTGQPALELARLVGGSGSVTATDVSPSMLARAETLAMQEGLANARFDVVDAHELRYPAGSFEVATCRFAVMYFADPIAVFRRVRSSLTADGRFASLVWGDPSQPILSCTFGPAQRLLGLPTMPPGAPSATRYSEPGSLTADLLAAGFAHVEERTYSFDAVWAAPAETLWDHFTGALVAPLAVADGATRAQ